MSWTTENSPLTMRFETEDTAPSNESTGTRCLSTHGKSGELKTWSVNHVLGWCVFDDVLGCLVDARSDRFLHGSLGIASQRAG